DPGRPRHPEGERPRQGGRSEQADRRGGAQGADRGVRPQGAPLPAREGESTLGGGSRPLPRDRAGLGGVSDPVAYVRIAEGEPLPDISEYAPYRAVVVIDATHSDEWQNEVSKWLVDTGCLYMMAWGENC